MVEGPNVANLHSASRVRQSLIGPYGAVWHFVEEGKFTLPYQALEDYFNEKAREEGMLTEKQYINLRTIDLDTDNRVLNLQTELYRLLEN